jgi:general secretion pathway protein N
MRQRRSSNTNQPARVPVKHAVWGGLLGTVLALALYAPAAWLSHAVMAATDGKIVLAEPRGTVWDGSAEFILAGGAGSQDAARLPSRVNWTLRPALHGAKMALQLPCCSSQDVLLALTPGIGKARLDVQASRVNLPAHWLSGLGAPWNTLAPEGQLSLSNEALSIDMAAGRTRLQGKAMLELIQVSSRLSTLKPLGDYRLELLGGDVPSLQLSTLQGALQLSGSGQFVGSRIRFSGVAQAAEQREDALANLLNIIGRRQGAKSLISLG